MEISRHRLAGDPDWLETLLNSLCFFDLSIQWSLQIHHLPFAELLHIIQEKILRLLIGDY